MGVSFEQFVAVRASIERGESRAQALARHQLTALQWRAAQRRWLRELVREAKRGGDRYGRRFGDALLGLAQAHPSAEPAPAAPVVVPAPPISAVAAPVAPPAAMPPATVVPSAAPGAGRRPSVTSSMAAIPEPGAPSLPFRGDANVVPRSVAEEVAREAELLVGETGFVPAFTDDEVASATPFESARPSSVASPPVAPATSPPASLPASPRPAAPPEAPAASALPPSELDTTGIITKLDLGEDPLPFTARPPGTPLGVEHENHDLAGNTSSVPALRDDQLEPLPFAAPAKSQGFVELSIEQYASLRAELDRTSGVGRLPVLARYGIAGEDGLVETKRRWADRFRVAPEQYGSFRAAYDAFSQWLAGLK